MSDMRCKHCGCRPCGCERSEYPTRATRDVLRWSLSACDLLRLGQLAAGGALLVVLDAACARIEAWLDQRGEQ